MTWTKIKDLRKEIMYLDAFELKLCLWMKKVFCQNCKSDFERGLLQIESFLTRDEILKYHY